MKVRESIPLKAETLLHKISRLGAEKLNDDELLTVIGGSCQGRNLIELAGLDVASMGLPPSKAARLVAAFELAKRLARAHRRSRPSCRTPEEVVPLIAPDLAVLDHERLMVLPLDPHSRLIGEPRLVSVGDVDGTEAGPRKVLRIVLVKRNPDSGG